MLDSRKQFLSFVCASFVIISGLSSLVLLCGIGAATFPPPNDYDWDGLTNDDEMNFYHTDPMNPDTDFDGFADGYEVYYWDNIHNIEWPDGVYTNWFSDPDYDGSITLLDPDSDNDFLTDAQEARVIFRTNAFDQYTIDGNGFYIIPSGPDGILEYGDGTWIALLEEDLILYNTYASLFQNFALSNLNLNKYDFYGTIDLMFTYDYNIIGYTPEDFPILISLDVPELRFVVYSDSGLVENSIYYTWIYFGSSIHAYTNDPFGGDYSDPLSDVSPLPLPGFEDREVREYNTDPAYAESDDERIEIFLNQTFPGANITEMGVSSESEPETGEIYLIKKFSVDNDPIVVSINIQTKKVELGTKQIRVDFYHYWASLPHVYKKMSKELRIVIKDTLGYLPSPSDPSIPPVEFPVIYLADTSTDLLELEIRISQITNEYTLFDDPLIRFVTVELFSEDIFTIANEDFTSGMLHDSKCVPTLDQSIARVRGDSVRNGIGTMDGQTANGNNVRVSVMDSGIDNAHPDLAGRVVGRNDFTDTWLDGYNPNNDDTNGHGTHVAGIVGMNVHAAGTDEDGDLWFDEDPPNGFDNDFDNLIDEDVGLISGMAPSVDLLGAKWTQGGGDSFRLSAFIRASTWSMNNNADIIQNSNGNDENVRDMGSSGNSDFSRYVDWLVHDRGLTVVNSAGNSGNDPDPDVDAPGDAYNILSVGASNANMDGVAFFSSHGTDNGREKPDVVAPGFTIASARHNWEDNDGNDADGDGGNDVDSDFVLMSGTSMAAPHTSGLAALLYDAGDRIGRPNDPLWVKAAIINSAEKINDQNGNAWTQNAIDPLDTEAGAGQIDALAAYNQYVNTQRMSGSDVSTNMRSDYFIVGYNGGPLDLTLVWERDADFTQGPFGFAQIFSADPLNDIDLHVYDLHGTLLDTSLSAPNNVEHIHNVGLAPQLLVVEIDPFHFPRNWLGNVITPNQFCVLASSHDLGGPSGTRRLPPFAPTLISPVNDALITDNTPTLTWQAPNLNVNILPQIWAYQVQISQNIDFSGAMTFETLNTNLDVGPLGDGQWFWRVRTLSIWGEEGYWSPRWTFTIDTIAPPTPSPQANPSGWTSDTTPNIYSYSVVDATSGVNHYEYQIDSTAGAWTNIGLDNNFNTLPLTDGTHTVYVRAVDNAGHEGNHGSVLVYIDITLPPTPSPLANPSGWTSDTTPNIYSYSVVDQTSGVNHYEYQIDSTAGAWTNIGLDNNFNTPPLTDGTHTVYVRAVDNAGNEGGHGSVLVYIDTTLPPTPSPLANPSGWTSDTTPNIYSYSVVDPTSGVNHYEYQIDSTAGAWTNIGLADNFNTPPLTDGTHTVYVRAVDNAGHEGGHGSVLVYIDVTLPPTPSPLANPSGWTSDNTPTIYGYDVIDTTSGVAYYEYQIDGSGAWTNIGLATSFNTPALSDGTHTIHVRAVDNAGNIGLSGSVEVYIDTTPPVAVAESDQTVNEAEEVIFDGSGSYDPLPNGGPIEFAWDFDDSDGTDWVNPDSTEINPTWTYADDGTFTVTLRIIDFVGLFSLDTLVVTVLNVAPTVKILSGMPIYEPGWAQDDSMLDGTIVDQYSWAPVYADLDNDGDLDLTFGGIRGSGSGWTTAFSYFENTGTPSDPSWSIDESMFSGILGYGATRPVFGDMDFDGDYDLIYGDFGGLINYYENTGTAANAIWTDRGYLVPSTGPYPIDVGLSSAPTLGDLDNDGDLDMIIGESDGWLNYFENIGFKTGLSWQCPNFEDQGYLQDSTGSDINHGQWSHPSLADLDNDGDLDLIFGRHEYESELIYYENIGTGSNTIWTLGPDIFPGIFVIGWDTPHPTFSDLDSDGDLDLTIGWTAEKHYYENIMEIYVGDTIQFRGSFFDPGWLDTHIIEWDFGDGSPVVTGTLTPTYVYTTPGIYTVTLTVTDDDGASDSDSIIITIL